MIYGTIGLMKGEDFVQQCNIKTESQELIDKLIEDSGVVFKELSDEIVKEEYGGEGYLDLKEATLGDIVYHYQREKRKLEGEKETAIIE